LIDPLLVILAPPAVVFGWAMLQMHKADQHRDATPVKVDS
jgi:hypothetical protein